MPGGAADATIETGGGGWATACGGGADCGACAPAECGAESCGVVLCACCSPAE